MRVLLLLFLSLALCVTTAFADFCATTPIEGASDGKINNIALASNALNGLYIAEGESFSFNDIVGPRTEARGYETAPNGRGADVTGGGVGQVATTLYLALLQDADIELGKIRTYGSRFTDNYTTGDQAIVVDYNAGTDLTFTNLGTGLTVYMVQDEDGLTCTLAREAETLPMLGFDNTQIGENDIALTASDADALANARIAAESIDDIVLTAGDVFSFNETVGPREARYGYINAVNGRGATVIGGGVGMLASALWLAVKDQPNVVILSKNTYGERFSQTYVEDNGDAILIDYNAGTDFTFKYIGSGSLTLNAWTTDTQVVCSAVEE